MGQDKSGWKKIFQDEWGFCRLAEIPPGTEIDVVIDDVTGSVRKVSYLIESWAEVGPRLRTRVESKPARSLHVFLFDERAHVPPSKQPTQRKRLEKSNVRPFEGKELAGIRIERGEPIPEPRQDFIKRVLMTPALYPQLFSLCCAELSKCVFPSKERVRYIMDGGYADQLPSPDSHNGYYDHNARDDESRAKRPQYMMGTFRTGENESVRKPYLTDSGKIGEADLKIAKHISQMDGGNVYVRTPDFDVICILLLHMRGWIDPVTKRIKYGIFVDTSTSAKSTNSIVDVVALWRSMHDAYATKWPGIPPTSVIEAIVMLVLLTGSDFTDGFSQLGPAKIWKSFQNGGHAVLFRDSDGKCREGQAVARDAILMGKDYGDPEQRHAITLAEHKIYDFMRVVYCHHLPKIAQPSNDNDMAFIRKVATQKNKTYKCNSSKWFVPEDEELYAAFRRIMWTIDYWLNGSKPHQPWLNPLETDPIDGLSKYGWTEKPDKTGRMLVQPAKRVHRIRNPAARSQ